MTWLMMKREREKKKLVYRFVGRRNCFWHDYLTNKKKGEEEVNSLRLRLLFLFFSSSRLPDSYVRYKSKLFAVSNQVRLCGKNGIKTRSRFDALISPWKNVFSTRSFVSFKVNNFRWDEYFSDLLLELCHEYFIQWSPSSSARRTWRRTKEKEKVFLW